MSKLAKLQALIGITGSGIGACSMMAGFSRGHSISAIFWLIVAGVFAVSQMVIVEKFNKE